MSDDHLQRRADTMAARVEALAEALRAGGVSEEASAQLLSRASATVLQALNLELLTSEARALADAPAPDRSLPRASYCVVFDEPLRTFRAAA